MKEIEVGMIYISKGSILDEDSPSVLRPIDGFRLAAPFDRSLASLDLRHTSNEKPEDGYDITLTAALSPQTIFLQAGAEEIEALCEIVEAEALFDVHSHRLIQSAQKQLF